MCMCVNWHMWGGQTTASKNWFSLFYHEGYFCLLRKLRLIHFDFYFQAGRKMSIVSRLHNF